MTRFLSRASALAAVAAGPLLALPAAAEQAAGPDRAARQPQAADPEAAVPPVAYRSAFTGYRPLADGKVGWKDANAEVGRIGGWRSYAREAQAPEPAASAAPGPVPAQRGRLGHHGGHGDHGEGSKQ